MQDAAKDVSMHVAALNPKYISRDEVSAEEVDHERQSINRTSIKRRKTRKYRC